MKITLPKNQRWVSLKEAAFLIAQVVYPLSDNDEILITSIGKIVADNSLPVGFSDEDIKILNEIKFPTLPCSFSDYDKFRIEAESKGLKIMGVKQSSYHDALLNRSIAKTQHLESLMKSIQDGEIISHRESLTKVEALPNIVSTEIDAAGLTLGEFKKHLGGLGIQLTEIPAKPAVSEVVDENRAITNEGSQRYISKVISKYKDAITPVIIDAYNECHISRDAVSNAEVLSMLAVWANSEKGKARYPTLLEEVDGEIKWQGTSKVELLNIKRLGDRLRRLKKFFSA